MTSTLVTWWWSVLGWVTSSRLNIKTIRFSQMIFVFTLYRSKMYHQIEGESFIHLEGNCLYCLDFPYSWHKFRNYFFALAIPEKSTFLLDYWFSC